eukprot:1960559-Prymnesium_polylepis.1
MLMRGCSAWAVGLCEPNAWPSRLCMPFVERLSLLDFADGAVHEEESADYFAMSRRGRGSVLDDGRWV